MEDSKALKKIAELMDHLAGHGEGSHMFGRLLESAEPLHRIATEVASSKAIERPCKEAPTLNISQIGRTESSPEFIGVSDFDDGLSISEQYKKFLRPTRFGSRSSVNPPGCPDKPTFGYLCITKSRGWDLTIKESF
jgi:hypothetical protein